MDDSSKQEEGADIALSDTLQTESLDKQEMPDEQDASAAPPENDPHFPKEKPIALKRIPGTSYAIAITNLKHEIFVNLVEKTFSWDMPDEIIQVIGDLLHEAVESDLDEDEGEEEEHNSEEEIDEHDEKVGVVAEIEPHSKRMKGVPESSHISSVVNEEPEISEEKKKEMNLAFKELLRERRISPFCSWDVEVPKLAQDSRFQDIKSSKERRKLFDEYCAEYSHVAKQEATGNRKDAQADYQQLLEEAVKPFSRFDDFVRKYKKDERFQRVTNSRERQTLFTQYVHRLRVAEAKSNVFNTVIETSGNQRYSVSQHVISGI